MSRIRAIVAGIAIAGLAAANVIVMLGATQLSSNGGDENALDHRPPGGWVLGLVLHHGQHESGLAGSGVTGHLPTYLVLHVVLVLALVPLLLPKNIVRTPLQAESFVAEGAGWRGQPRAVHRNHVIAMAIWTAPATVERDYSTVAADPVIVLHFDSLPVGSAPNPAEGGQLLKSAFLNCSTDAVNLPTYILKASRIELDA